MVTSPFNSEFCQDVKQKGDMPQMIMKEMPHSMFDLEKLLHLSSTNISVPDHCNLFKEYNSHHMENDGCLNVPSIKNPNL